MALSQEQEELAMVVGDGTWDEVDPDVPVVLRTRVASVPDDLDEGQVALAAELDAMHVDLG